MGRWPFADWIANETVPDNIADILSTTLYRDRFLILNYWSFVHFSAGIIFYYFFPTKFRAWVIINIIFEITEYILGFSENMLFYEEPTDILLDLMWSLGGFVTAKFIREKGWRKILFRR